MSVVEETWKGIEAKLRENQNKDTTIDNVRSGFCAAVYACSAMIVHENAKSRELSEAAQRIETKRSRAADRDKAMTEKAPMWTGLFEFFPNALQAVALASRKGHEKRPQKEWLQDGAPARTDSLLRHLRAEAAGETIDADTGLPHAAQVAWNALARLELILQEAHASVVLQQDAQANCADVSTEKRTMHRRNKYEPWVPGKPARRQLGAGRRHTD